MIGGLAAFTNATSLTGQLLYILSAMLIGYTLYLLLSVFLVELLSLLFHPAPLLSGMAALALAMLVSAWGMINAFTVREKVIEVEMAKLEQPLEIMHWTDIHLGHFRGTAFLERLVRMSNAAGVDAVMITGDLFDGKIRLGDASLAPLKRLQMPVFFVAGNHDGYSGVEAVKEDLRAVGVHVLSNQVERFGELQIIGLNHMLADENSTGMHALTGRATIRSVLDSLDLDSNMPTILLHHSPDGLPYAQEKGVDLYLSGHTHAGQLFPMTWIGELIYEYNKGLHDYRGTRIFVGEGAGTFGPPMRVGTHSTITRISLNTKHG
jgi:predicted MPP superfamily phosphohydrolase